MKIVTKLQRNQTTSPRHGFHSRRRVRAEIALATRVDMACPALLISMLPSMEKEAPGSLDGLPCGVLVDFY